MASGLKGAFGSLHRLQHRFERKGLPEPIRKVVATDFKLDDSQLARIRHMEKMGHIAGRRVRYVRIFDPSLVKSSNGAVESYEDLNSQQQAILFEGHTDPLGYLFLKDRRPQRDAEQSFVITSSN